MVLSAAPLLSPMAMAEPIATNAKHLYIVDFQTGSVLYDKMGDDARDLPGTQDDRNSGGLERASA